MKLRNHIAKLHDKIKSLECTICDKTFYLQRNLNRHIKIHDDKSSNKKMYQCDLCNKIFKKENYIEFHKKTVHEKQKMFKCDICFQSFSRTWILNVHQANYAQ